MLIVDHRRHKHTLHYGDRSGSAYVVIDIAAEEPGLHEILDALRATKSFTHSIASDLLSETRELLPDGVPLAPVFLMVAVAYCAKRSQKALTDLGRSNALGHADNLLSAIDQFEWDLSTFRQANKRKTGKGKGTGQVHMEGVELLLCDGKLTELLKAIRQMTEEEKARIAGGLKEIRATQEDGVMPDDRHKDHFGALVYDVFIGCEQLIAQCWQWQRGSQQKERDDF